MELYSFLGGSFFKGGYGAGFVISILWCGGGGVMMYWFCDGDFVLYLLLLCSGNTVLQLLQCKNRDVGVLW